MINKVSKRPDTANVSMRNKTVRRSGRNTKTLWPRLAFIARKKQHSIISGYLEIEYYSHFSFEKHLSIHRLRLRHLSNEIEPEQNSMNKFVFENETFARSGDECTNKLAKEFAENQQKLLKSQTSIFKQINEDIARYFDFQTTQSIELYHEKLVDFLHKLKSIYFRTNFYRQIVLLDTVYKIKYQNLKDTYTVEVDKFSAKTSKKNLAEKSKSKKRNFFDFIFTRKKTDDSKLSKKNRSKSVNFEDMCLCHKSKTTNNQHDCNEEEAMGPDAFKSSENLTSRHVMPAPKQKSYQHHNERDQLEYKYEQLFKELQDEIVFSIRNILVQIQLENELLRSDYVKKQKYRQRTSYSRESSIERKIRLRKNSDDSTNLSVSTVNLANFKYRNTNAKETCV